MQIKRTPILGVLTSLFTIVLCVISIALYAQAPSDGYTERPYDEEYQRDIEGSGPVIGGWGSNELEDCPEPLIQDISFVVLTTGEIYVEVVFDTDAPLPSLDPGPHGDISIRTNDGTYHSYSGPHGSGANIYRSVLPQGSLRVKIQAMVTCLNLRVNTQLTEIGLQCPNANVNWPDHPNFEEDWEQYQSNPGLYTGYRAFLNDLPYLTSMQRYAFYQHVIIADCLPIDQIMIGGLIWGGYGPNDGPCSCSEIIIRREVSPGSVRRLNVGDIGISGQREFGTPQPLRGNDFDSWGNEYFKGPARWIDVHNDNHRGTSAMRSDSLVYTGNGNYAEISARYICTTGDRTANYCGCDKILRLSYEYWSHLTATAYTLSGGSGTKSAASYAFDAVSVSVARPVTPPGGGQTVDEIEILEFAADGSGAACGLEINAEFVAAAVKVVGSALSYASAAATGAGAASEVVKVAAKVYGGYSANKGFDAITTLASEPPINYFGSCTPHHASPKVLSMSNQGSISLLSGQTVRVRLSSYSQAYVAGQKSYYAMGQVASAFRLGLNAPSKSEDPSCCSENGASWMSATWIPSIENQELRDRSSNFASIVLDNVPNFVMTNDAGSHKEVNTSCGVTVDALHLSTMAGQSITFYNTLGQQVHKMLFQESTKQQIPLANGVYIAVVQSENGEQLSSSQRLVIDGALMSTDHE